MHKCERTQGEHIEPSPVCAAEAYKDLANAYAKLKGKNNVILNMEKAFGEYLNLDNLSNGGDYWYKSPLLKGEIFNKSKIIYGAPLSATEGYIKSIDQMRSYDWLKDDDDFISLYKEMKSKIIPFSTDRTKH